MRKRYVSGLAFVDSGSGNSVGNSSMFPYFDYNVSRNVTTAVGQSAFLHCRVEQLGDKAVGKHRTLNILSTTNTRISRIMEISYKVYRLCLIRIRKNKEGYRSIPHCFDFSKKSNLLVT